jgi:hypothetical protein
MLEKKEKTSSTKMKAKTKTKTKVKGLRQRKKPDVKGMREKDRIEDKIIPKPPKFIAKSLDVVASEESPSDEPLLSNSFLKKWKKSLKGVGQV